MVFAGCCWSLFQYVQNMESINNSYLKAKVIPTPLDNDHVRFSWLVSVAIICCFLIIEKYGGKALQIILISLIAFFIIYLHILSARMGLMSFYIFFAMYAAWMLIKGRHFIPTAISISALVIFPIIAWFTIPTFENRIKYFIYDFSHVRANTYLPGSSDGARFLSIKAGWDVVKKHPLGVGAGDLKNEVDQWYKLNVGEMVPADKFLPCSEWMMYGGFAGWPGIILFSAIMLLPFLINAGDQKFYWVSLNIIAAFSFVFDMGIETQYGTFIYCFIILWWWKWLQQLNELH